MEVMTCGNSVSTESVMVADEYKAAQMVPCFVLYCDDTSITCKCGESVEKQVILVKADRTCSATRYRQNFFVVFGIKIAMFCAMQGFDDHPISDD